MKKLLPIFLFIIMSKSAMAQLEYANGIANTVMNNYKDIMENLDDKSDIQTDEEILLFSETESEEEEIKKKKRKKNQE
jgi:hypothetical protein